MEADGVKGCGSGGYFGGHPTEEELTAYAATTGRFALYPYIREYVYDLTGRLALPPLTLEILSRPMPVSPGAQWPATRGTP